MDLIERRGEDIRFLIGVYKGTGPYGQIWEYTLKLPVKAALIYDSTVEARIAGAQYSMPQYTVITALDIPLKNGVAFRRERTGEYFRLTTAGIDDETATIKTRLQHHRALVEKTTLSSEESNAIIEEPPIPPPPVEPPKAEQVRSQQWNSQTIGGQTFVTSSLSLPFEMYVGFNGEYYTLAMNELQPVIPFNHIMGTSRANSVIKRATGEYIELEKPFELDNEVGQWKTTGDPIDFENVNESSFDRVYFQLWGNVFPDGVLSAPIEAVKTPNGMYFYTDTTQTTLDELGTVAIVKNSIIKMGEEWKKIIAVEDDATSVFRYFMRFEATTAPTATDPNAPEVEPVGTTRLARLMITNLAGATKAGFAKSVNHVTVPAGVQLGDEEYFYFAPALAEVTHEDIVHVPEVGSYYMVEGFGYRKVTAIRTANMVGGYTRLVLTVVKTAEDTPAAVLEARSIDAVEKRPYRIKNTGYVTSTSSIAHFSAPVYATVPTADPTYYYMTFEVITHWYWSLMFKRWQDSKINKTTAMALADMSLGGAIYQALYNTTAVTPTPPNGEIKIRVTYPYTATAADKTALETKVWN